MIYSYTSGVWANWKHICLLHVQWTGSSFQTPGRSFHNTLTLTMMSQEYISTSVRTTVGIVLLVITLSGVAVMALLRYIKNIVVLMMSGIFSWNAVWSVIVMVSVTVIAIVIVYSSWLWS